MKNDLENNIIDAIFNFYLEADSDTIRNSLNESIENIEDYNRKKKQTMFLFKAKLQKIHNERMLEIAKKFQEAILLNVEKPISFLKQIIQQNPSFALYRNLDKLSKEDIVEIIKDKNLIELLEQMEGNKHED
ncbi:MAG: hypothetical protein M0P47_11575 [Bacteroidales bacterium]|nr:hypothetical protein [Bacteroidales bacterium]